MKSHHRTQFHGAGLLGWGRGGCWAPNPTYKSKASSKSGCSSFLLHWVVRATTSGNSCRGSKVSWTKGSLEPGGVQTSAPSCWGSWGGFRASSRAASPAHGPGRQLEHPLEGHARRSHWEAQNRGDLFWRPPQMTANPRDCPVSPPSNFFLCVRCDLHRGKTLPALAAGFCFQHPQTHKITLFLLNPPHGVQKQTKTEPWVISGPTDGAEGCPSPHAHRWSPAG